MNCAKCNSEIAEGAKFCGVCGISTEIHPEIASEPLAPFSTTSSSRKTIAINWKKLGLFGGSAIAAIALVGTLFAIPGLITPLTKEQIPAYGASFLASEQKAQSQTVCASVQAILPAQNKLVMYRKRTSDIRKVVGKPRKALKFVNNRSWAVESQLATDLKTKLDSVLVESLTKVASNSGIFGISASNAEAAAEVWKDDFKKVALQECGLASKMTKSTEVFSTYDRAVGKVISVAATAPWYPEGYSEWALDDNLAWKWSTGATYVDCYDCSYWVISVVSRDGCPGGVYAEINIEKFGTVIDWTNDTLSYLGPGKAGRLVLTNYPSQSNLQGSLQKLNCYAY